MEVKNDRPDRARRTRTALTRHAREVFAEEGYARASVDEIVRRADLTKGALYHHFDGKEGLYRGVVEEMAAEIAEAMQAAARGSADPWRRIEAMCDAYLDTCLDSELARILVLEAPTVLGWEEWCRMDAEHVVGSFADALAEACVADDERSPETAAQVVRGVLSTAAQVIATADDPPAARREVEGTVKRLLAGLRTTG